MKRRVRISDLARADMNEIWRFIAADNVAAADRLQEAFIADFHLLGDNGELGRRRDDIKFGLRGLPISTYIILYRITDHEIQIVRVVSRFRDVSKLF